MRCPICERKIDYVKFSIPIDPCTGEIKVNDIGKLSDTPDFDPDDMTGGEYNEPTFKCPECYKDITKYITNVEDFDELANQI